jgi:hypothetical protein
MEPQTQDIYLKITAARISTASADGWAIWSRIRRDKPTFCL